jgi:hypothetical protein
MIAAGAPVTEVQHRLGHANPAITLQVYSHFFKHTESDAADRLANDVLNGSTLRATLGEIEKSGHSVATLRPHTVEPIAVSAR